MSGSIPGLLPRKYLEAGGLVIGNLQLFDISLNGLG